MPNPYLDDDDEAVADFDVAKDSEAYNGTWISRSYELIPSRATLNRDYQDGTIDQFEYRRMKTLVIRAARGKRPSKEEIAANTERRKRAGIVRSDTSRRDLRDMKTGARWDFGTTGGAAFMVYIGMYLLVGAVLGISVLQSINSSGSDLIDEFGSMDAGVLVVVALYAFPTILPLIVGVVGLNSSRGSNWATSTVLLSLIANPTFVLLGTIANPTWLAFILIP